jgi:hypothetical protein
MTSKAHHHLQDLASIEIHNPLDVTTSSIRPYQEVQSLAQALRLPRRGGQATTRTP